MTKLYKKKRSPLSSELTSPKAKMNAMPSEMTIKFILGYAASYRTMESKTLPKVEFNLN